MAVFLVPGYASVILTQNAVTVKTLSVGKQRPSLNGHLTQGILHHLPSSLICAIVITRNHPKKGKPFGRRGRKATGPVRAAGLLKMKSANGQRILYLVLLSVLLTLVLQTSGSTLPRNLSNNLGASLFPAMAIVGDRIYIAWDDDSSGNSEILYIQSIDGGKSFSSPQNLSNNAGKSRNATMAALGDEVYIFWDDDTPGNAEIFYRVSRDGGQTFSPLINLSQDPGRSILPKIALSSSQSLYIVWQDDTPGNREVLYARSTDGGRTFTAAQNLSQNSGRSLSPVIAVTDQNIHVAWEDNTPGNHEIFYVHSSDDGLNFSSAQNLSRSPSFSAAPNLAASKNSVYVTWTEQLTEENYEILFEPSSDNGNHFNDAQNISHSPTYSGASVVAASGDEVSLLWIEGLSVQRNGKPYVDYDALYARSSSNDGFSTPQNLSMSEGATVNPYLVTSEDRIYVAFADETPGNFEVFLSLPAALATNSH